MRSRSSRTVDDRGEATGLWQAPFEPLDQQQALLLHLLRDADGSPVSFATLQQAGVEFPASVACELELSGAPIEHCEIGSRPGERRARLPALRMREPSTSAVAATEAPSRPGRVRARAGALAALAILIAAVGVALAATGGHSRGRPERLRASAETHAGATPRAGVQTSRAKAGGRAARTGSTGTGSTRTGAARTGATRTGAARTGAARSGRTARASKGTNRSAAGAAAQRAPAGEASQRQSSIVSSSRAAALEAEGHSLLLEGRSQEAVPLLRAALAATGQSLSSCLTPVSESCLTYAYALYDLGRALQLSGDPTEAVKILARRLKIENQRQVVEAALAQARASATGATEAGAARKSA